MKGGNQYDNIKGIPYVVLASMVQKDNAYPDKWFYSLRDYNTGLCLTPAFAYLYLEM